jgi:hypothetical protein
MFRDGTIPLEPSDSFSKLATAKTGTAVPRGVTGAYRTYIELLPLYLNHLAFLRGPRHLDFPFLPLLP